MKIYHVYVARLLCDGIFSHYETVAYCATKEIAQRVKAEYKRENQKGRYWIGYLTDSKGDIKFYEKKSNLITE